MMGFIKRIFGSKNRTVELTLKNIGAGIEEIEGTVNGMSENVEKITSRMNSLVSMAQNIEKMARGMDALSGYFEFELKQAQKITEIENIPPGKHDFMY